MMEGQIERQSLFVNGMYSYDDINDYIHQYIVDQTHAEKDKYPINILFILFKL